MAIQMAWVTAKVSKAFTLYLPCVTASFWMSQIAITCWAFFCTNVSHNRDSIVANNADLEEERMFKCI